LKELSLGLEHTRGFKPLSATWYFCSLWSFHLFFVFFVRFLSVSWEMYATHSQGELLKSQAVLYVWWHCVNGLLDPFPFRMKRSSLCTPAVCSSWRLSTSSAKPETLSSCSALSLPVFETAKHLPQGDEPFRWPTDLAAQPLLMTFCLETVLGTAKCFFWDICRKHFLNVASLNL